ncbi:MAG: vitamin B12 dependent-methionine synthase activation domain-containing protein [bacterium]
MNHILHFKLSDLMSVEEAALLHQGIPKDAKISRQIQALLMEAIALFADSAEPIGMMSEVSISAFDAIYKGKTQNAEDTPLEHIFPRADRLDLFALTMGQRVSDKISTLFAENDFALAAILDSVASVAADKAVELCEDYFFGKLLQGKSATLDTFVLGYSPGYCGWHISGQKKLFEYLQPEKIGITLNESYLMAPLKSVSGVLVAGPKEIHIFKPGFSFCKHCQSHSCAPRLKSLLKVE